ncbi:MAG: Ig-like domain repeat protein [Saprospiraceae bacterium]
MRVGTGGGSIEADDDCGISSMAMNIGGTTTTSLNGVGRSGLTSSDVTTMSFTICSADWSAGDLFIGMGTGTTFTGNGTFSTNDLLWGLQLNNGALEFRTLVPSQWNVVTPAPTFANNTCYNFHIVANGSASAITDYAGTQDLAAGRMDIYINENLVANDINIVDNQSSTAFRIYQISGGARYCIDDIRVYNAAQPLPCSVTAISAANLSACNSQNTHNSSDDTFTANVTVTFSNAPASGNLVLSGDGSASVAVSNLNSSTSHTFTGVTMNADGTAIALTAAFSADNTCTFTNNNAGTAPNSCSPTCTDGIQNGDETGVDCGGTNCPACPTAPTMTTVTSSQNPSFTNDNVTFTATVTSGGNPVTTGTVTFSEGATVLAANVTLNGSGQASFSISTLTEGSHPITATYNGTTGFATSMGSVTQVVNNMTVVNGNSFCNTGSITLADGNTGGITGTPGTPYPSNIFVSGLSGTITSMTVDIKGLNHGKASDVDLLLVAPTGQTFLLMTGVGQFGSFSNANLTLSDAGASALPQIAGISSGTYRPASYEADDRNIFPAPAPAGAYNKPAPQGTATFASVFNGLNPNGTWQLYATDDTTVTVGSIANGWCLNISTVAPCNITAVTFSDQSACNDNGTMDQTDDYYTADITVTFSNPPSTGFLELEQSGAVIDVVSIAVGSLVGNSHTFQDVRLKANGMANAVEAQFSADQQNCVRTAAAPEVNSCSPICDITSISFDNVSACNNNGTADTGDDFFTADVTVAFVNAPSTGTLRFEPGPGNDQLEGGGATSVSVTGLTSPYTFTGVRFKADGTQTVVEIEFSDLTSCVQTAVGPTINNCPCNVDLNGATVNGGTNPVTVCSEEAFSLTADGGSSVGLANGDKIDWYYSSNSAFTPGIEGTFLGSSTVTAGMAVEPKNSCSDIAAGEIALVSVQSDNPDVFAFVTLVDLAAGVEINFTDAGWTGAAFYNAENGFITWTAPAGGTSAGTTITITINGDPDTPANVVASSGTATYSETGGTNDFALSGDGDQVIAFCGTAAAPSAFLAGVHTYGNVWDASFVSPDLAQKSLLPPGLTVGQSAVAIGAGAPGSEVDNGRFNCTGGSLAGTAAEIAASIYTAANWTTSNDMIVPAVASCTYDIETPSSLNISTLETSIDDCGTFYVKGIVNPLPGNCSAAEVSTSALEVEILCPAAVLSDDVTICEGQSTTLLLTISGAPANQSVSGNITNGTVDINFAGMTDANGSANILINDISQAGTYQIETILIGEACDDITTDGTATVTVNQPPVVTIVNQTPVVCSSKRFNLATLQASITLEDQAYTGVWDVLEADSNGSFRDANDVINATFGTAVSFVPGAADIERGFVTLILRSNDPEGPCEAVEATVKLTILRVNCGDFPWNGQ